MKDFLFDATTAGVQFLRTELIAGLTFSKIALRSKNAAKADRNRINARKAYDALLHFTPETSLSSEDAKEINAKMAQLRANLQQLGEDV